MRQRAQWLVQNSGQALIEYALILALASLGIISALVILQRSLGNTVQVTGQRIDAVAGDRAGRPILGEPAGGASGGAGPGTGSDDDEDGGGASAGHGKGKGNGKGNSGYGKGNGGSNGRK